MKRGILKMNCKCKKPKWGTYLGRNKLIIQRCRTCFGSPKCIRVAHLALGNSDTTGETNTCCGKSVDCGRVRDDIFGVNCKKCLIEDKKKTAYKATRKFTEFRKTKTLISKR